MSSMAPEDYQPTTRERLSLFRRLGRRSGDTAPVVLQAAGYNVDLGDESAIQATIRNREQWQTQVWDAIDACGEVSNGVMTLGNLLSRIQVFVAEYPSEADGEPVRTTDADVVKIGERLGTPQEVSMLLKEAGIQKLLPGEYQLIGIQPGPDRPNKTREEYFIVSIAELKAEGAVVVTHASGASIKLIAGQDTWIRIWSPHPRDHRKAYSPLRPLLNNIDELVWWDMAASAVAKSRLGQVGMVMFPNNIEAPVQQGDPPGLTGTGRAIKRWVDTVVKGIREPGHPSAAVPTAMSYPWNDKGVSGVEVINFPRNDDELLAKRSDYSLRRIAQGFPLPPEHFFGAGDATYGGATQITRDKFSEQLEPFVVDLLSDWTRHWLRPILTKSGKDPDKFLFWYDASNLLVIPRWEEQMNKGVELGMVAPKAWRRVNNVSEADKMDGGPETAEEMLAWIRALRGREGNPSVQEDNEPTDEDGNLTPSPTELKDGESHPPRSKPPAASRGKGQPVMASLNGNGHRDLGQRLAEIDADLMSRLQVMATEETRQALRKAGNFISNRARKNPSLRATIKNVAPEDVASTLGREHVNTLGTDGMLDDTFSDVPQKFSLWCDRAVDASIEAAELPTSIVASGTFQLAYSTDDAATQLVRDLKELAASLLFATPSASSPEPESTDSIVPARIIRRALAAVGNPSPNGHTDLLLATGRTFTRHLADAGHFVSGHKWVYPTAPFRHPFNTHRNLDGKVIQVESAKMTAGDGSEHCVCLMAPVFDE